MRQTPHAGGCTRGGYLQTALCELGTGLGISSALVGLPSTEKGKGTPKAAEVRRGHPKREDQAEPKASQGIPRQPKASQGIPRHPKASKG
jgi:hypothetical protein